MSLLLQTEEEESTRNALLLVYHFQEYNNVSTKMILFWTTHLQKPHTVSRKYIDSRDVRISIVDECLVFVFLKKVI